MFPAGDVGGREGGRGRTRDEDIWLGVFQGGGEGGNGKTDLSHQRVSSGWARTELWMRPSDLPHRTLVARQFGRLCRMMGQARAGASGCAMEVAPWWAGRGAR